MDPEEWEEISNYLTDKIYPARVHDAKIPRFARRNFARKMASYQMKENKIFKVITNILYNKCK